MGKMGIKYFMGWWKKKGGAERNAFGEI